jgi:hypothetical protein
VGYSWLVAPVLTAVPFARHSITTEPPVRGRAGRAVEKHSGLTKQSRTVAHEDLGSDDRLSRYR